MKRREFLKNAGFLAAGVAVTPSLLAETITSESQMPAVEYVPGDLNQMFPPKNLKAVSTEPGVIVLTWDATGPDVSYDTYCGTSEEAVRSCKYGSSLSRSYYSSTNKETIKKLKSGVTYYIMVTTLGENGIRLSSEIISIVVK